ncbi:MAG: AAA family ATPase [Acidimicrobiales bacterium]
MGQLTADDAESFARQFNDVLGEICQVVRGKEDEVAMALVCLFAEGHLLIEDVPGTGKTVLAKSIANVLDGSWSRIQFTPDLLPADVTGGLVYSQRDGEFELRKGPIFANIVLADEINRASPKTQSALLEVMEERQVTIGTATNSVPRPFIVIATQNPVEQAGTYRLPEAQVDRFLMRISLGYPDREAETAVLMNAAKWDRCVKRRASAINQCG